MKRHQGFKRVMSFLSAILLLIWMVPVANLSADISGDGYYYNSSNGVLTITNSNGPTMFETYNYDLVANLTDVVIASSTGEIYGGSFYNYTSLRRITIESGVYEIGDNAFEYCENLERITFQSETPPRFWSNIFTYCPAFLVLVPTGCVPAYENYRSSFLENTTISDFVPISSISLDYSSLVFSSVGASQTLHASVTPIDAENQTLYWSSSDENVATVNDTGTVTAVGPGEATIYVRNSATTVSTYCRVVVSIPDMIRIDAQPSNAASCEYGYYDGFAPTMTFGVSKTASAPINSTINYQWYRVKSGAESNDVAVGTDSSTLNMPVGLPVGTYEFYCVATCGETTLTSQRASFSVLHASPNLIIDILDSPQLTYGDSFTMSLRVQSVDGPNLMGTLSLYEGTTLLDSDIVTAETVYLTYDNFSVGDHTVHVAFTPATDSISENYQVTTTQLYEIHVIKSNQDLFEINPFLGAKVGDANIPLTTTGGNGNGAITYSVPPDNGVLEISGSEAIILDAGKVTITAVKAADDNYESATATYDITIEKGNSWIEFDPLFDVLYPYTAEAIPNPTASDIAITGGTYSDVTFTWYMDSIAPENLLSGAPSSPGTYVLVASIAESDDYLGIEMTIDISIIPDDTIVDIEYNNNLIKTEWYNDDVSISASGYTVSDQITGPFLSAYIMSDEGTNEKDLYFKNTLTGRITSGQLVTVNIDRIGPAFLGPTDGIMLDGVRYRTLLPAVSYDEISNSPVSVRLSATVTGSPIYQYRYFLDTSGSTTAMSRQLLNQIEFEQTPDSFLINSEGTYVLYAYAIDWAGNRSDYICSDGFVIDLTRPELSLTSPGASEITDSSATVDARMNEKGTLYYVLRTTPSSLDAEGIISAGDVLYYQVSSSDINIDIPLEFSELSPNTTYYVSVFGRDIAGNTSDVRMQSFTTNRIVPVFAGVPTVTGVYGQQVKDMQIQQLTSTNGVAGTWSVVSTDVPSVGTTAEYTLQFTPENPALYDVVTVQVVPQVSPRALDADGVSISEVTDSFTYNKLSWEPVVTVTDTEAAITTDDYFFTYADNINAGQATITITGQGNYTGSLTRHFTIAKALLPSITFPSASAITYGQALSESVLVGGSTEFGTFAWETPNVVPTVRSGPISYNVVFTPDAALLANYDITTMSSNVSCIVFQAVPDISFDVSISGSVGSRVATITVRVNGVENGLAPTGEVVLSHYTAAGGFEEIGSALLENGVATYQWSGLAEKVYDLYVAYAADENYESCVGEPMLIDVSLQRTPVEDFVYRMYQIALKREPDSVGFSYWVEQINAKKMTGAQVAYGLFFSTECQSRNLSDREFVSLLYRGMFAREADAQGLENWLNVMKTGVSRKFVLASFVSSQEWINHCGKIGIAPGTYVSDEGRDMNPKITTFVTRMYSSILGRSADSIGLNHWTSLLNQQKITGAELARSFVFSQEVLAKNLSNEAFVELMYQGILGRSADSVGKANWIAQLAAGKSRMDVLRGFVYSQEYVNLCARYGIERGNI